MLAATTGERPCAGLVAAEPLLGDGDIEPADQVTGSLMLYTSATTGRPKGVPTGLFTCGADLDRTHRTLAMIGDRYRLPVDGRTLLAGPWYHAAQLFFSLIPLLRGSTLVLRDRFGAGPTLVDLTAERISHCHLVPTHFVRLLGLDPATRAAFDGSALRRVWHGGAACPVDVKRRMIDWWGPVFTEYYAATEAGIVTHIDTDEWLRRPGSVGRPQPPNEVVVVDPDRATPLPVGATGAVYVRRPASLDFHYHNAPEKTAAAHLGPGYFTVGDLGHVDAGGFLYLTGRGTDTINSGGVNIYPAEVEEVLLAHPAVLDAAVVGIPDDEFGERVMAVIQLAGEAAAPVDTAALDRHCREHLADFKRPRIYRVIDELPREATGKLNRRALRDPYWPPVP